MYCVCARSETTALALLLESCLRVPTRVCSPASVFVRPTSSPFCLLGDRDAVHD